jgi:biotin carboxylase
MRGRRSGGILGAGGGGIRKPMNFLLIEHGGIRKQFTLEALERKNLNVYLACSTIPDWLAGKIDSNHIILVDTYNAVKLLAAVVAFMERNGIDFSAMGTFFEGTVTQTADVARALGVIGLDPGAARRSSSNKLLMRRLCRNAGIPTPRLKVANLADQNQLEAAINEVGVPCVIKPIFGAESCGIIKVEPEYIITDIVNEITLNATENTQEVFKDFTGDVLVEEYMPGKVVSIDGIVQAKEILFAGMVEFAMGPEPRFIQEASYIPARVERSVVAACKDMASEIIETLGFDNCGFHCELRLTPDGPVLLEIAARLPGGPLQRGYKQAYGFDLTSSIIDLWLGQKIALRPSRKNFVLQKAVFSPQPGKIRSITGLREAQHSEGVWEFEERLQVGDTIVTYPNVPTPYYYYGLTAKSAKDLERLSQKVESTVAVEVSQRA